MRHVPNSDGAAVISGSVSVRPVSGKSDLKHFIELPKRLYRGQPGYVAPLDIERAETLDPAKNPYFGHAEVQLFLAWRGDKPVGRISAQICRLYQERYQDATGHFGFIDAIDDPAVYRALTSTAEDWLRQRGMKRIVGPLSFSTNEETGLLIDGFNSLPMLMMPYHAPYAGDRLEDCDYSKAKDVIAYDVDKESYKAVGSTRLTDKVLADGRVRVRPLDMKHYRRDLSLALDIFNDAWSENWGMIPFTQAEIEAAAAGLKPLIDPKLVAIAEVDGEAAGMLVCVPNLLEAVRDLNGALLPFGWIKLIWRLKVGRLKTARVPLMGIRKKHHGSLLGATLLPLMFGAIKDHFLARGLERVELSWILEDNVAMQRVCEGVGARAYKTYRVYEKALT